VVDFVFEMSSNKDILKTLPKTFTARYLGCEPANGLWGIKHTRKPVNVLVEKAKAQPPTKLPPIVKITIDTQGLHMRLIEDKKNTKGVTFHVESISYGVQDILYNRVFCMIVVREKELKDGNPFLCHAFGCETKEQAKAITLTLSAIFENFGEELKKVGRTSGKAKKFVIDLRPEEEITKDQEEEETEA